MSLFKGGPAYLVQRYVIIDTDDPFQSSMLICVEQWTMASSYFSPDQTLLQIAEGARMGFNKGAIR